MAIKSLEELYLHELKDLYSAEQQILTALPKMIEATSSLSLREAFERHLEVTRTQVERLEEIFGSLERPASGSRCPAMEGIISECEELLGDEIDPNVLDAALIAAAQKVEHYEMAGYGTVRTYAEMLGHKQHAQLLQETLDEEEQTDKELTALAEEEINAGALASES